MTEISENIRLQSNTSVMSSTSVCNSDDELPVNGVSDSEDAPKRVKRRVRKFSDSDDNEKSLELSASEESKDDKNSYNVVTASFKSIVKKSRIRKASKGSSSDSDTDQPVTDQQDKSKPRIGSDSESDTHIFTTISHKSRMQKLHNASSSDSEQATDQAFKYEAQQMRMKNKRNKIKDKFKSLISSRDKENSLTEHQNESVKSDTSGESDENEGSSIEKIKQNIKERMSYKPSICDPDTSEDESESKNKKSIPRQRKDRKTILTSPKPKPQRMSAKQAMENMQKIKSESNRMLREKEVSLPYHRPKALSLKDIMSRRKTAVSSDGKCLPIKMNGEQLKQYAQMLEDRQKQMMELWQSDTDDENDDKKSGDEKPERIVPDNTENAETKVESVNELKEIEPVSEIAKDINADISAEENDKLFDDILSNSKIDEENDNISKNESVQETSDKVSEEQDSETNMKLVFNESETSFTEDKDNTNNVIEDNDFKINDDKDSSEIPVENKALESAEEYTETDSHLVSLRYDSETLKDTEIAQTDGKINTLPTAVPTEKIDDIIENNDKEIENIDKEIESMDVDNGFSDDDDDMNIHDIDNIIENAEIIRDFEDKVNSQVLIRDRPLNLNPKLTGSPGMVIDLDDNDTAPKKSGVELLKERFTFFAKLKTPEEMERAKERRIKPGNQHLKLKQDLEEQMAEQRSLEWTKRLELERQQQKELKELRGENSDDENDIDKLDAKLEENKADVVDESADESEEEELLEDDVDMKDKPRVNNPLLENEAEESECDEHGNIGEDNGEGNDIGDDGDDENENESSDESESSESEDEQPSAKKGRILKAFEDSDDEEMKVETKEAKSGSDDLGSQAVSQDDVLTLAQRHKSVSEDLFASQGSSLLASQKAKTQPSEVLENDEDLGTQTFSILDSTNNTEIPNVAGISSSDKFNELSETQTSDNLDSVALCSFSQSLPPLPITQISQSQTIGENILQLCTGNFYENEFISQVEDNNQTPLGASQAYDSQSLDGNSQNLDDSRQSLDNNSQVIDNCQETNINLDNDEDNQLNKHNELINTDMVIENLNNGVIDMNKKEVRTEKIDDNLKSILEELDDPEFDNPKPNRFFCGATQKQTEAKEQEVGKKKFTIDSDDDNNDANVSDIKKQKKFKKKKAEKRALQISDDEEASEQEEVEDEYESEIEEENEERIVEYDSEENEIEIKPQAEKSSKKKRKGTEFFEQEAELTSEDEWAGSGDEDEAGLDRMEREAGDDESFHQGRLQRELGQIHMRDVLDQDKREVRIIQELLFEDGDLGAGGRQRKFKWKNLDGDEENGTGTDEFGDTQEEEFESEEQWRKQRHERETFLRQFQNNDSLDESLNISIDRTSIIKANLMSNTMSVLEENQKQTAANYSLVVSEKKKDHSPKKSFPILQQSYQGSILNRGKGALARLAALATPLAVDDDAPKGKSAATSSRRNFVFATLTPEAPKVTKRKAVTNPGTPALVKKMKTEEKQNTSKSRLLDHMKV